VTKELALPAMRNFALVKFPEALEMQYVKMTDQVARYENVRQEITEHEIVTYFSSIVTSDM